jgi:hypothetical protein
MVGLEARGDLGEQPTLLIITSSLGTSLEKRINPCYKGVVL